MENILVIIVTILLLTIIASILLNLLFQVIEQNQSSSKLKIDWQAVTCSYSAWIGYFERILIYCLLATNNVVSIAIIVTLKGFVRYPEINQNVETKSRTKLNAEKFLLGTLFSLVYTAIVYVTISNIM